MTRYASVYPLVTARALAREFTYEIPGRRRPGAVVEVRFGNSKQRGVVTEVDVRRRRESTRRRSSVSSRSCRGRSSSSRSGSRTTTARLPDARWRSSRPCSGRREETRPQPAERDALTGEAEPAELSATQQAALERIIGAFDAGEAANFLLYGATGSGKTEVYLQACAAALNAAAARSCSCPRSR